MTKHFDFAAIPLPIEYPWILPDYDDCDRLEKVYIDRFGLSLEEAKRGAKLTVDARVKARWNEISRLNRARFPE